MTKYFALDPRDGVSRPFYLCVINIKYTINPIVTLYDIYVRKGEVIFVSSVANTTRNIIFF
jgi:hypothetical protein